MKRFWVAHVRGADFQTLRKKGFTTLDPALDDYVFLEETESNRHLLRKQSQLRVSFMKKSNRLVTVSERELQAMQKATTERGGPGAAIEVVEGFAAGLEGKVLEEKDGKIRVELQGWRRKYEAWLDPHAVVYSEGGEPHDQNNPAN